MTENHSKAFGVVFILREWLELFGCFSATKTALPKMCQVGTAGTALPNLLQVWLYLPNLQQVWFIYTKLAVSMAVQAILGAFPAVPAV